MNTLLMNGSGLSCLCTRIIFNLSKESKLSRYSMVSHEASFYIFGGLTGKVKTSIIARFEKKTKKWSKLGNLVSKRDWHRAIFNGRSFLIVGGDTGRDINSKRPSETCISQFL